MNWAVYTHYGSLFWYLEITWFPWLYKILMVLTLEQHFHIYSWWRTGIWIHKSRHRAMSREFLASKCTSLETGQKFPTGISLRWQSFKLRWFSSGLVKCINGFMSQVMGSSAWYMFKLIRLMIMQSRVSCKKTCCTNFIFCT